MPSSSPPPCSSNGWWLATVVILSMLAGCQPQQAGCVSPTTPRISSVGSLTWRCSSISSSARMVTMVVKKQQREDGDPGWVCAHHGRLSWRSYGACSRGRLPAVSIKLPYLLTEWWSSFFLPAMEPKGRQRIFSTKSMARCHGGFAALSGVVPGDGDVVLVREMLGTRLRFPSACWGPLCTSQGPACNFLFLSGLVVSWLVLVFPIK